MTIDHDAIARAQAAIENGLIEALQSQTQADMDGTTVIVSRQACDEAAEFLPAIYDEVKRLRADLEQGQLDYCDLMTRHDAHFVAWQSAKSRAEKVEAERDRVAAEWAETSQRNYQRAKAAEAERDALRAALSPFAKAGELFSGDPGTVEFDQCIYSPAAGSEYALCGDDLRRARQALKGQPND